jgi:hypothetical protein
MRLRTEILDRKKYVTRDFQVSAVNDCSSTVLKSCLQPCEESLHSKQCTVCACHPSIKRLPAVCLNACPAVCMRAIFSWPKPYCIPLALLGTGHCRYGARLCCRLQLGLFGHFLGTALDLDRVLLVLANNSTNVWTVGTNGYCR